jgi:hypothetical protein
MSIDDLYEPIGRPSPDELRREENRMAIAIVLVVILGSWGVKASKERADREIKKARATEQLLGKTLLAAGWTEVSFSDDSPKAYMPPTQQTELLESIQKIAKTNPAVSDWLGHNNFKLKNIAVVSSESRHTNQVVVLKN